jgi:hypothetical protein
MATQFDFSNLGSMFGGGMGGTPTGLDALLSEDQRKLMGRNAALSAAAALLQASGRSATPIGLGQALGSALQAGQQGYQQGRAGSIQDLLLGQKLEEAKRAEALRKQIADVMTTAPQPLNTAQAALAAPGMPLGPTIQRAELMDSMPQPTANELKANQYQTIADIYAAQGKSEDAQRYQQIAERLNPRPEAVGQPFLGQDNKFYLMTKAGGVIAAPVAPAAKPSGAPQQVMGADGKPALVQNYDDGSYKIVSGVSPLITPQQVDTGAGIQFVNPFSTPAGKVIPKSMSPSEAANLRIRQAEFNRGAFDIKDTPDGLVYVPKAPGGAAMPITGPSGVQLEGTGAKPTEDQSKSAGFAFRMKQSTNIFNQPVTGVDGQPIIDPATQKPITLEQAFGRPGRFQAIMRSIPSAGLTTGVANVFETSGRQQYRQAQENWVTANLRPESGAVIGVEEMEKEITKYFPQASDSPQTIAQKQRARRDTELAMTVRAGPAYKQVEKAVAARPQAGTPRLVRDPVTGVLRYVAE